MNILTTHSINEAVWIVSPEAYEKDIIRAIRITGSGRGQKIAYGFKRHESHRSIMMLAYFGGDEFLWFNSADVYSEHMEDTAREAHLAQHRKYEERRANERAEERESRKEALRDELRDLESEED